MRVISILNFKGGVGKSSLAENLSYALALQGCRVLVIDADRQGNASTTLLRGKVEPTLTQVLMGSVPLEKAIHPTEREGLSVVPSDANLDEASTYLSAKRIMFTTFRKAVQALADRFDYVFLDHAGAYTLTMEAGLLASQEILIPCELEAYAVQGLFGMFAKLQETLADHELHNAGIIPYSIDLRYGMARQYLRELRETFGHLITAPVRTDALVSKAQSVQMTVLEYETRYNLKSRAAEDFRTLAHDLIEEEQAERQAHHEVKI